MLELFSDESQWTKCIVVEQLIHSAEFKHLKYSPVSPYEENI